MSTTHRWADVAARQAGVIARSQLTELGFDRHYVRTQLRARRWQPLSATVLSTTTGPVSQEQRLWCALLHADRPAIVGGLTALRLAGLSGWDREELTVVVPKSDDPVRLAGVRFTETRRDLPAMTAAGTSPPRMRIEPAALLFAAYDRSERTACGLLAAVVQQRLTHADRLREELAVMRPLRRAPLFRMLLSDIGGGSHSASEVDLVRACRRFGVTVPDRQTPRRDRNGRRRWLDAEWLLDDGSVLVLEVDGAFHMNVQNWWDDMVREREQVIAGRRVLRCSSLEIRHKPDRVMRDLVAAGVPLRSRPNERGA